MSGQDPHKFHRMLRKCFGSRIGVDDPKELHDGIVKAQYIVKVRCRVGTVRAHALQELEALCALRPSARPGSLPTTSFGDIGLCGDDTGTVGRLTRRSARSERPALSRSICSRAGPGPLAAQPTRELSLSSCLRRWPGFAEARPPAQPRRSATALASVDGAGGNCWLRLACGPRRERTAPSLRWAARSRHPWTAMAARPPSPALDPPRWRRPRR